MKYLYLDKERFARGEPAVAIRDEKGNVDYDDEIVGFGFYRMTAPIKPLTPTGPVAWVETYNLLTVRNVAIATLAFWLVVIWLIFR